MRTRTVLSGLVILAVLPTATAANLDNADPGWITADSPFYPLDLAVDKILKPPGEQVHERASEALVAAEANNSVAVERALSRVNRSAAASNGVADEVALQQAEAILLEVQDRVPDEARSGIKQALDAVTIAKNRFPTDNPGMDPDTDPEKPPT